MKKTLVSVLVVSVLVTSAVAEAQEPRPERPYRGLFESGTADTEQLLALRASAGGGWDDNLVADALGLDPASSDVTERFRGGLSTGSAGLSYLLDREAIDIGAFAGTTARYYPSAGTKLVRRDYGSVGTEVVLGPGLSARAGATYQPFSTYSMLPSLTEPLLNDASFANEDFPASSEHYFGYSAGLDFTRPLSRRVTFAAYYDYQGRESKGSTFERFDSHTVGANVSRALGRDLSLRLGYAYSEGRYGGRENNVNHVIDVGVNYNRALSFSRRTTLSFSSGTSAWRTVQNGELQYHLIGGARLNHEIGRTWDAGLSYERGLSFSQAWMEPVFSDSVLAALSGLIHRRVQLQFTASAVHGRQLSAERGEIESYGAATGVTVGVTRHISTGVTGTYYSHDLGSSVPLPPGFAHDFERRSIRAFVSVWAPLFQRSRTP